MLITGSNDILTSGANAQPSPSVTESMMNESRSSLNVTSSPEVTTASLGQDTPSQTSGQTSELTSLSHSSVSSTPVPAQKEEQSGHVTTTATNTTGRHTWCYSRVLSFGYKTQTFGFIVAGCDEGYYVDYMSSKPP